MALLSTEGQLENFEYESSSRRSLKGNIYLARVERVEPSLQAAFLNFGGGRDGFISFGEIHPDYYRIPIEDQKKLIDTLEEAEKSHDYENAENAELSLESSDAEELADNEGPTFELLEDAETKLNKNVVKLKKQILKKYKIQEVIQRRQLMLVQILKDERNGKGAALTTYVSLPGRYGVLMPNTPKGGGISKKITNPEQHKRLKRIASELSIPKGMGFIIRTAGVDRNKGEIKKDADYLSTLWEELRQKTIHSTAPALIHEEGNLVIKTLRDFYSRDVTKILIEGEKAYKEARDIMRKLIPSHVKKIQLYNRQQQSLFQEHRIEEQIAQIHAPKVKLPSGAYLVINITEALTAIDVNSGRSTRERHISDTALKTNLEAAAEIPRQLQLRDLGGLIVIDFIDMDHGWQRAQVEKTLDKALKKDKARIQKTGISIFGLLEMSRQRMKPSLMEARSLLCPECHGTGMIESLEASALQALRALEDKIGEKKYKTVTLFIPSKVGFYLFNEKRAYLDTLENTHEITLSFKIDETLKPQHFRIVGEEDHTLSLHQNNTFSDNEKEGLSETEKYKKLNKIKPPHTIEALKQDPLKRSTNKTQKEDSTKAQPDVAKLENKIASHAEGGISEKQFNQAKKEKQSIEARTGHRHVTENKKSKHTQDNGPQQKNNSQQKGNSLKAAKLAITRLELKISGQRFRSKKKQGASPQLMREKDYKTEDPSSKESSPTTSELHNNEQKNTHDPRRENSVNTLQESTQKHATHLDLSVPKEENPDSGNSAHGKSGIKKQSWWHRLIAG